MKKKKIALVTGATGGLGNCFLEELQKEPLDEIWAFGRNKERLNALKERYGDRVRTFEADFTSEAFPALLRAACAEHEPEIVFLVNNAGAGILKATADYSEREICEAIDLNCKAAPIVTGICLPYLTKGSHIINISSAASFQPLPYFNFYAASKAFLRSYSRALHIELKPRGISVTAVCPGWIRTPFLMQEVNGKKMKYPNLLPPERVAKKAMKDAKRGKDMSVCSLYTKFQHLFVKLLPQKWVMRIWGHSINRYFE